MAHNNLHEDKANQPDQKVFEVHNVAAKDHHFGSVELQSIHNENITNLSGYVAQAIRRKFKDERGLLHVASEHLYVAFVTKVSDLVGKIKTFVAELIERISYPPCVLRVRANLLNRLQIIDLMKNFGHDVSVTMEGTCPEPDDDQKLYGSSARVFLRPKSALPKKVHYKTDGKLRQLEFELVPPKPKSISQRRGSSDGRSSAKGRRHGRQNRDSKKQKPSHEPSNREDEIRRQFEAAERRRKERLVKLAQEQLRQKAEHAGRTAAAQAAAKALRVASRPDFSRAISRASASEQSRRQSSLTLARELDSEEMPLTQPDAPSSPPSRPRNANLSPLLPTPLCPETPKVQVMRVSLQNSSHHSDAPNAGSSNNESRSASG